MYSLGSIATLCVQYNVRSGQQLGVAISLLAMHAQLEKESSVEIQHPHVKRLGSRIRNVSSYHLL